LRWGLIGAGHISGVFAEDMSMTNSGRVVAIGSRSQDAADGFGEKYDVPRCYGSYEALVADPDV
jgi:predicted dehydrogenase